VTSRGRATPFGTCARPLRERGSDGANAANLIHASLKAFRRAGKVLRARGKPGPLIGQCLGQAGSLVPKRGNAVARAGSVSGNAGNEAGSRGGALRISGSASGSRAVRSRPAGSAFPVLGQCVPGARAVCSRCSGSALPVLGQRAPGARAACSRRSGSVLPALGQCASGAWAVLTTREQCSRQDSRALAGRLAGRDEERPSRCVRLLCPTLSSAGGEGGNRSVRRGRHFVSSAEEASARALLLPRRHPCRRSSSGSGPRRAPAG